jgi:hypothetical protein
LRIKTVKSTPLSGLTYYLGPGCLTGADDLYVIPADYARRVSIEDAYLKWALRGEDIRDWMLLPKSVMIVPYRNADGKLVKLI